MMSLLPVFGFLLVGSITPGPNTFLVLNAGLRGGTKTFLPVIFGIIAGAMGLFSLLNFGIDALTSQLPYFSLALALIGSGYLIWLGLALMRPGVSTKNPGTAALLPNSFMGLAGFQFVNPKAWALQSTAIAAAGGEASWLLMIGFALISFITLFIWGLAGVALSSLMKNPKANRIINLVLGASLVVFAAGLIFSQFEIIL